MDLLGSILDKMEKPPQTSTQTEKIMKKQQETLKKMHEAGKEKLKQFRHDVETKLQNLMKDDLLQKIEFEPMEKIHRTVIHDIADRLDLVVYSFGTEGVDRHSVVYKKEFKPTDDELLALKEGDAYDRKFKELQQKMLQEVSTSDKEKPKKSGGANTQSSYQQRYASILGDNLLRAEKITITKDQYGMVPTSNKRDLRSIEQILHDNKVKKKKKREEEEGGDGGGGGTNSKT